VKIHQLKVMGVWIGARRSNQRAGFSGEEGLGDFPPAEDQELNYFEGFLKQLEKFSKRRNAY